MKSIHLSRCAAGALLLSLAPVSADELPLTPVLESTTHLGGSRTKVVWSPQSNVRYRVEKSADLSSGSGGGAGGWSTRALVEGGEWTDPEPPGTRAFYRVPALPPEVFEVQPAVVAQSGGMLTLVAQCLPPGSMLRVEIPGEPALLLPIMPGPNGSFRVMLNGLPPGTPYIGTLSVVNAAGQPVATVGQTLEVTVSGLATESPPVEPPAMSSRVKFFNVAKGFGFVGGGNGDRAEGIDYNSSRSNKSNFAPPDDGGGGDPLASLLMPALMKAKEKANRTKCSSMSNSECENEGECRGCALPGEVTVAQEVLSLATPAGPDLSLSLHYRSRAGTGGVSSSTMIPCGPGWTCSYDLRIVPVPLADGANAARLLLYGGDGRRDVLVRQPDGTYTGDGMFREGRFDPDTTFRLTFSDKSQCIFCRLVGAPWSGRIGSIADANGVAINFTYDAASRLTQVASQFGQNLTLGYDPTGALSAVTDHTGRSSQIIRYGADEPQGSAGDLKSVSCPQMPGQLPLEGPSTFTYSTGSPDVRLNHNLLTARDGADRLLVEYTYSAVTDPASLEFDTCASEDAYRQGTLTGNVTLCKFEPAPPLPGSPVAYRCTINDPEGRVCECDFDAHHRMVACREFTGFATPGTVTTSTTNRPNPATKRRATDPDYYETTCAYNPDHRIKNRRAPDGTQMLCVYAKEWVKPCPVRERGNVHSLTLRTAGGEERTIYCDYAPGFGTCEGTVRKQTLYGRQVGSDGEAGSTGRDMISRRGAGGDSTSSFTTAPYRWGDEDNGRGSSIGVDSLGAVIPFRSSFWRVFHPRNTAGAGLSRSIISGGGRSRFSLYFAAYLARRPPLPAGAGCHADRCRNPSAQP